VVVVAMHGGGSGAWWRKRCVVEVAVCGGGSDAWWR
jgi:hypothetical protein